MSSGLKWSRREWLATAAASIVPSGLYYRDYSRCLPNYLSALARRAYEHRNRALAELTTPHLVEQRQHWARETFWRIVGGQPERTPLNATTTGQLERAGYRIEKVIYESRPGIVVSANLYIPTAGNPPYPGILFQMGHANNGKSYALYQKCCQGLVQLGHIVLAFDPMGQGERIAYSGLSSADEEHSLPGRQLLLLGDSATRSQAWDAVRSLDYLASHPLVDPKRLASTGQSGGATVTMFLCCVDDRLSAAAISSGITENFACANFNAPGSTDDAEQNLISSAPEGFDRWDLLYPIAPKPLLIQVSAHDFFGTYSPRYLKDGREQFARLSRTYALLKHPERLSWQSVPLTHGLSYELRLDIYNWFERWLKNSDRKITQEPPVTAEEQSTLWVGPTGCVTKDFQSLRPFDLIKQRTAAVKRSQDTNAWVRALNIQVPATFLKMITLAETPLPGIRVKAGEVNSATDVWIPVWHFTPEVSAHGKDPLIVLDDRGRNTDSHEEGLYHRLAQSGSVVYAADIRGLGDSRPEVGRGNPNQTIPHDSEEDYGWASLILGDSLLAQRIVDILAVVQAVGKEAAIAARGSLTVPALFAFALAKQATSLYLAGGLVSYQNVLETEDARQSVATLAWRLFEYTDLPLLASSNASRHIHIAGAVDASDKPLPVQVVRDIYRNPAIQISADPAWDEAALGAI